MSESSAVQVQPSTTTDFGALAQMIINQSNANSARSEQLAADQRRWTERQTAAANEFSAQQAALNRDWQMYMSNTAHQREVADLKAAGLNPVLSASGGNGAAVTSGATASAVMGSGSKADVDTSANGALASILGSVLTSMTQLANTATSANAQLAVAEKQTAMQQLIESMREEFEADHPSGMYQAISSVLDKLGVSDREWSTIGDGLSKIGDSITGVFDRLFASDGKSWRDLLDGSASDSGSSSIKDYLIRYLRTIGLFLPGSSTTFGLAERRAKTGK